MSDKPLTKEKLKHYKEILLIEVENSQKLINQLSTDYKKGTKDSSGDLSGYTFHQADQGSDTHEQEKNAYLLETEYQKVKLITAAINKIQDKTFGLCELCGHQIADARLEIIPYVKICVKCQEEEETRKK
ncbi:MAG: TraR/DksA C4-type zinc finger protein [Candidatus Cloacimonetes bacterium]|nr:TraR/DksA C4-type zinc finger protein [Candidatus Cloacimonadota bacterium]